jgi:hypothetical protein
MDMIKLFSIATGAWFKIGWWRSDCLNADKKSLLCDRGYDLAGRRVDSVVVGEWDMLIKNLRSVTTKDDEACCHGRNVPLPSDGQRVKREPYSLFFLAE